MSLLQHGEIVSTSDSEKLVILSSDHNVYSLLSCVHTGWGCPVEELCISRWRIFRWELFKRRAFAFYWHWFVFDPGRTNANLVAPPHTVASIKRHLSRVEDIAGYACIKLFCDTSSAEPLDDNSIIPILTGAGPGSTPGAPIALVVSSHAETRSVSSSPKSAHRTFTKFI